MPMPHADHTSPGLAHRGRLAAVLAITLAVLVVQVAGAWLSGSLALLADAGHLLTDVAGLTLALAAVTLAARPPTPQRTYGNYRLEILAAVANALLLFAVAAVVLVEAWRRWSAPPEVDGGLMLVVAVVGLVANAAGLALLHSGAQQNLNVRGAYLEVLGDLLGSLAVVVAALVVTATGWLRADPAASALVALMMLPRVWTLVREATDVLLEAAPRGVDLEEVRRHILGVPGVVSAHDLHAWTITSGMPVLSVHVVVADDVIATGAGGRVLDQLEVCLAEHFDVRHCTFQLEPAGHAAHEHPGHA
ncbi:MAG: cation diffusion facilitator family transporter [Actinomycetia bacterium]|nr:cation diffusion facilitator family transporter [Actinomycetes bacterium]